MEQKQVLYIAIDDSGKLSTYEKYSVYAGIVFFNINELNNFILDYQKILDNIKCHYRKNTEIKNVNILNNDKKKIITLLNNYYLIASITDNSKIYKRIINSKKSKGRFIDYNIKILIKRLIISLIKENKISNKNDLKIIIYIDEQNYNSNGFYNLKESIYKELKMGMTNIKNNTNFKPIINSNLIIELSFLNSYYNIPIQAADIIAGTVRKDYINKKKSININNINTLP